MKRLKQFFNTLLVEIDSSSVYGRSIQRFRLVGLPSIPVFIAISFYAFQLQSYHRTILGYRGMYDRALFRYTVAKFISKIDIERAAFTEEFLLKSNQSTRESSKSCIRKNETNILKAIKESNAVLYEFVKIPYIPSDKDLGSLKINEIDEVYNSTSFMEHINILRHELMNTGPPGCSSKFYLLMSEYTQTITGAILISPNFYESELSKVTFMHVFALQHALEVHRYMSALCYMAYEYFTHGRFINVKSEIDFQSNLYLATEARKLTLSLDASILQLYERLLSLESFSNDEFNKLSNAIANNLQVNVSFSEWHSICREVAGFSERFEEELTKKVKKESFDLEWRNCVAGIIFYSLTIFINIPAFIYIIMNSETTIRNLKQFSTLFQSQVDKLFEEKIKSEMLLYAMLPKTIARKLTLGLPIEAESFESCTVFFGDYVDFNEIVQQSLDAVRIVDLLNHLFNLLDLEIECFDVYKVETIGSVYMVVSGVPIRNGQQHVVEVADMSLDILAAIDRQKFPDIQRKVELRIGIHTGPCVAGVVGNKMTRYCLFGDTVNTASRMQSTGSASRIHLSESSYNELDATNKYIIQKRGNIEVKGKGIMTTYWLQGTSIPQD